MENNLNNKEFEQFVKQNADQYRMYPSEKVWEGIYSSLHNRRRRFVLFGLILLALSVTTATWIMVSTPPVQKLTSTVTKTNINPSIQNKNKSLSEIINPSIQTNKYSNSQFSILKNTQQKTPSTVIGPFDFSVINNSAVTEAIEAGNSNKIFSVSTNPLELYSEPVFININDQLTDNNLDFTRLVNGAAPNENEEKKGIQKDIYPLSIESVLNSYKAITTKKKITLQAYFAPTISYRKLSGNNAFLNTAAANNSPTNSLASLYNVNKVVTHKPSMGLELGLSVRYPITKNIKVKAGLQFNINRYDIRAFKYSGELATISLSQGASISSVSTWTKYRNFGGYSSNWLQNYYFSVSTPIGAEMIFAKNKNAKFGVSSTIQPTYVLHDRAYLITTNYKNYAQIPWLIRRWNVNTSLDAFVNYSMGKIKWQIGPQVRYQLLSSFQNKYPVKENLYDFGLKMSVMFNH